MPFHVLFVFHSVGRLPPTFTFHLVDDVTQKADDRIRDPAQSQPFPARLVFNKRVTDPSHFQDVRHIEFDITGSNIE